MTSTESESTPEHELRYRVGVIGFHVVDGPPYWYCPCGDWRFDAKMMPYAASGNNVLAAERSYRRHLRELR